MEAAYPFNTLVPIYQATCVTSQKMRNLNKDAELNKIHLYFRPWACFHQSMNNAIFHDSFPLEGCLLLSVQSDQVSFETYDYSSWLVMYSPILLYLKYRTDVSCLSLLHSQSLFCPLSLSMHILDVSHIFLLLWYMTFFQMGMKTLSHVPTTGTVAFSIYFSI
jgi:hypothetical protein